MEQLATMALAHVSAGNDRPIIGKKKVLKFCERSIKLLYLCVCWEGGGLMEEVINTLLPFRGCFCLQVL